MDKKEVSDERKIRARICKWGKRCRSERCVFLHPKAHKYPSQTSCRKGEECKNEFCTRQHPGKETSINIGEEHTYNICNNGMRCKNDKCSRLHPLRWKPPCETFCKFDKDCGNFKCSRMHSD